MTAQPEKRGLLRREVLGGRILPLLLLILSAVIAGLCESAILALLASVALALVGHHSRVAVDIGPLSLKPPINFVIGLGLGLAGCRLLIQLPLSYVPAKLTADVQADLRLRLFGAFLRARWALKALEDDGRFQELATSQIFQATQAVLNATNVVVAGLTLAILMLAALVVQPIAAVVVLATSVLLFLLFRPLNRVSRQQARSLSSAQLSYAAGVYESVNAAEEIEVFGVGPGQERKMSQLVAEARHRFFATQFLSRLVPGLYQGLILLLLVGALGVLHAVAIGHIAALGAVILLLVRASSYGQQIQGAYVALIQSVPFVDRVADSEQQYRLAATPTGSAVGMARPPSLEFNKVSYAYPSGPPVLRGLSFEVKPGEAIGIVGPSGAGKSTTMQLLLRLREPTEGSYLVDGVPASDWSSEAWASAFAYVPQDPRVLESTVYENIAFLRDIDEATVRRAAALAHIEEEIDQFSAGFSTVISQRAKAVSGGQRQRICLARALAGSPSVIVLDEPTSALDPRSELLIRDTLSELHGKLTVIIIAHRMSTLDLCDRIMVIRNGELDAIGQSADLQSSNDFYRNALAASHTASSRSVPSSN